MRGLTREAIVTAIGAASIFASASSALGVMATGVVFEDANANGMRDAGERGIPSVAVSNSRDVVMTDGDGRYEIAIDDDDAFVFVIKPRGWMVRLDTEGRPAFFYRHCPNGAPPSKFGGVAQTGPLPASVDFPLTKQAEPDELRVILFGDPQPSSVDQVNDFANDVMPDVVKEIRDSASPAFGAAFGMSLGDIVHDDLTLYGPLNKVMGAATIPWFAVAGNHDMNYDSPGDAHATETFERVYGPATHAFQWGPAVFFALDDVVYEGPTEEHPKGGYHGEFSVDQLEFIRSVMGALDPAFMVFTMHIPLSEVRNRAEFLRVIGDRPSVSIAAHWHTHADQWYDPTGAPADPRDGGGAHHHIVQATTSGSWWQGALDEWGIPHATMRDGAPNGWSVLRITPRGYSVRFKGARKEWAKQMHIWADEEIDARLRMLHEVIVNVYAGSVKSGVEMRVVTPATGEATSWVAMDQFRGTDPYWARLKDLEKTDLKQTGQSLTNMNPETLLWRAMLPPGLPRGGHLIEVRTVDQYGQEFTERKVLRVVDGTE